MAAALNLVFWLVGAPIMAAGVWLIWRGLFADRPAGRRRCPACWYDMAGVPGLICPECGRAAPFESDLHQTRRSRPRALAGLALILGGYAAGMAPNLHRIGLSGLVPTTLLTLLPTPADLDRNWSDAGHGRMSGTVRYSIPFDLLCRRHSAGALWDWQARHLIRRDLDRVIFCREKWLTGEPLCVRMGPGWFGSSTMVRVVKVTPRIEGSPSAVLTLTPMVPGFPGLAFGPGFPSYTWRSVGRGDFPHTLAPVPDGTTELTFDVEVSEMPPNSSGQARVVFRSEVTKPVRVVQTPEEMMEAVESDAIARAIREGLGVDVGRAPDGKPYIHASIQGSAGIPRDVITGLKIEFLLDGQVIAWGQVRPNAWISETSNGWVHADMGRIADTQHTQPYRARVSSSISSAIRNFGGEKYWSGTFECPLSELIGQPRPVAPMRVTPIR